MTWVQRLKRIFNCGSNRVRPQLSRLPVRWIRDIAWLLRGSAATRGCWTCVKTAFILPVGIRNVDSRDGKSVLR